MHWTYTEYRQPHTVHTVFSFSTVPVFVPRAMSLASYPDPNQRGIKCVFVCEESLPVCVVLPLYAHCMCPAHSALPPQTQIPAGLPAQVLEGGVRVGEQALKEAPVTHYPTIHYSPPRVLCTLQTSPSLPQPSSPFPCPLSSDSDSRHTAPCTHTHSLDVDRRKEILFQ